MLFTKKIFVDDSYYIIDVKAESIVKCLELGIPCYCANYDGDPQLYMITAAGIEGGLSLNDGTGTAWTVNADGYFQLGGD